MSVPLLSKRLASCSITGTHAGALSGPRSNVVHCGSAFSTSCKASQAPIPLPVLPQAQADAQTQPPKDLFELVARYPRHPLMGFFNLEDHRLFSTHPFHPSKTVINGTSQPHDVGLPSSVRESDFGRPEQWGRSWKVPELRNKSSLTLHQLWYTCLLEANKLATTRAEITRVGLIRNAEQVGFTNKQRKSSLRKTMARIKFVLNERRLALESVRREALSPASLAGTDDSLADESTEPATSAEPVRLTRHQRIRKLKKMYRQGQNLEESNLLGEVQANELSAQETGTDPTAFDGIAEAELMDRVKAKA